MRILTSSVTRNLTDFYHFFGEFFTYSGNSWLLMIKRSVKKIGRKSNSMEVYPPISKTASMHIVWKLLKMSHLNFWILAFSSMFCLIKTDLSGNTVWPRASGFQKLAKMDHLRHFSLTFVHSKCKRSFARNVRNVKWDFFCDFQTLCVYVYHLYATLSLSDFYKLWPFIARAKMQFWSFFEFPIFKRPFIKNWIE